MKKYFISMTLVEHSCCWDVAIMKKVPRGSGDYGADLEMILECNKEHAEQLCEFLNSKEQ